MAAAHRHTSFQVQRPLHHAQSVLSVQVLAEDGKSPVPAEARPLSMLVIARCANWHLRCLTSWVCRFHACLGWMSRGGHQSRQCQRLGARIQYADFSSDHRNGSHACALCVPVVLTIMKRVAQGKHRDDYSNFEWTCTGRVLAGLYLVSRHRQIVTLCASKGLQYMVALDICAVVADTVRAVRCSERDAGGQSSRERGDCL